MPQILDVLLYGRKVGQITELTGDRSLFTFDEAYLADPARPTLGFGFKGAQGGIAYKPKSRQTRIEPYFSNLLPEGKLREYVAERDKVHPEREFQLLRRLGEDLPGAVIVRPTGEDDEVDEAELAIEGEPNSGPLKFSLAGVQMKLSALKAADGGLTIPAAGAGGRWIVKFPSERFMAVPQNEYWMMTFAARIGLTAPNVELVNVGDIGGMPPGIRTDQGPALAVRRFDRTPDGGRVHMEDFAQVFRIYPRHKYDRVNFEMIGKVIWQELGDAAFAEFIARLVFTAAIGNGDMHAKNWSVLHSQDGPPQLAPIYDFVSTLTYMDGEDLGLNLAGSKAFTDVSRENLEAFAKRVGAPVGLTLEAASTAAARIHIEWPTLRVEAELPHAIIEAIDAQIDRVPTLKSERPQIVMPPERAGARPQTSALILAPQLTGLFEATLPPEVINNPAAITATFAFALNEASSLAGPQEGGWSRVDLEKRVREAQAQLRALALEASLPAFTSDSDLAPLFRPRRGAPIAAERLPKQIGPVIAELGGRGSGMPPYWWLLAKGAGVALRTYPVDMTGPTPSISASTLVADLYQLLAFIERFAEPFFDATGVAIDIRWRGLAGVKLADGKRLAAADERRFMGPLGLNDLSRRSRPAIVAAIAGTVLTAFGQPIDAALAEGLFAAAKQQR